MSDLWMRRTVMGWLCAGVALALLQRPLSDAVTGGPALHIPVISPSSRFMTTVSLPLADALRDRCVLERELGRGGMATVYLPPTSRTTALSRSRCSTLNWQPLSRLHAAVSPRTG